MTVREQQVRALYRAALERPPAERESFVADLTGDDVELRKSVDLLLSSHDATAAGERAAAPAAGAELAPGTVVAHYRIDAVLGRGGMGVVYRATDTKLNRPVAIKFLAAAVPDPNVRRRFAQEAETTSGLNHPHIVTVFDVGEHEGQQYIVSELVDGGTLDDWAKTKRSRTWRQSVELLTGVADALAAAHAAGVLHRDVKPGNILIGSNGYAKLADFGLAKLVGGDESAEALKGSRTTRAGLVVGTVAYMSPEQAAGEAIDARSDVFSFGIVLYELLAGRPPFEAGNDLETLKSIAHAPPPPLPEAVPEPLQALVDKALEKAPGERYQTMQDLVVDLKRLTRKQAGAQAAGSVAVERRRARTSSLVAAALGVALVAALVPAVSHFLESPPAPARPIRFDIPVPGLDANGLAVSPTGDRIAYVALVDGVRQIVTRPLDSTVARVLPGTQRAQGIFASPTGSRLAFIADGKLKTIDVTGGSASTVTDYLAPAQLHGAWTEDDSILFTVPHPEGGSLGFARVAAMGGTPRFVLAADVANGDLGLVTPRPLPGDRGVVYMAGRPGGTDMRVYAARIDGGDPVRLLSADLNAQAQVPGVGYAAGFLLYRRDGTLLADRFDVTTFELRGEPVPIADNVAEFAAADSLLVYRTGVAPQDGGAGPPRTRRLVWVDRTGQRLGELETPPQFRLPVLSPDERSVALSVGLAPTSDVWTIDTQRGATTRVTFASGIDDAVAWSPDSARIAFNTDRDGTVGTPNGLYVRAANGTGPEEPLFRGRNDEILAPFDWSRDGRYLLFVRANVATWQERGDLWLLEMTGERTAAPLLESPFRKEMAKFSPDGRWLAYGSTESGDSQIFVQPFPDLGRGKWTISTRGGREPHWRGDGQELFYLDPDGTLMAVDLGIAGERLEPGQPQPLFNVGFALPGPNDLPDFLYHVSADGQRFLVNEPVAAALSSALAGADGTETPLLHVIVNWAEGLGAR